MSEHEHGGPVSTSEGASSDGAHRGASDVATPALAQVAQIRPGDAAGLAQVVASHPREATQILELAAGRLGNATVQRAMQLVQSDARYSAHLSEQRTWNELAVDEPPDGRVPGIGDQDKLVDAFNAALDAKQGGALVDTITKMSRETRNSVRGKLGDIANLVDGGDLLRIADMFQADLGTTLDAALAMSKPPSVHQIRAYLTDIHPDLLAGAFFDDSLRKRFHDAYPVPLAQVLPQVIDNTTFLDIPGLVEWWMATTPAETVARTMVATPKANVWPRVVALNNLGRTAWEWVFAIDDMMAVSAQAEVLTTFMHQAPDADLQQALADKEAVRVSARRGKVAKDLREHQRDVVANDSVDELAATTRAAGLSVDDQLALLLQRPGLTIEDVRVAAATWSTETAGFTATALRKLYTRFPDTTPADVFGFVPDAAYRLAIATPGLRPWFVDKAEPIEILRFVTFEPNHIAELCGWLVSHKIGYDWVYKLGGGRDDHLLRRFVLECPDQNVAGWVRVHIIADNTKPGGTEIGSKAIDPAAYESAGAAMGDDLGRGASAKEVSADVDALPDTDVAAIAHDTPRVKTLLERTDAAHVMRVIERVQPKLRDVFNFAPAGPIRGLPEWVTTRSDDDVIEALGHLTAAPRARTLLPALGALELFPQLARGEALAQVLLRNPSTIGWVMKSEPIAALTVVGSAACAGASVPALEHDTALIGHLPPGHALPKPARDGLAMLARMSTGKLHDRLAHKLDQERVDPEVDDPKQSQINAELMTASSSLALLESLEQAFETKPSAEVVLRICRSHDAQASMLVANEKLMAKVRELVPLSPRLVFPTAPLATLMRASAGAAWVLESDAAENILHAAMADAKMFEALVAALDVATHRSPAQQWADRLPRGKALSRAEKQALRRLATNVHHERSLQLLLGVRYDFEVGQGFDAKEIDRLWTVLERLPESHISEGTVRQLTEFKPVPGSTAGGEFEAGAVQLRDQMMDKGGVYSGNRSGAKVLMTKAEAMENLGLDETTFNQWVADNRLSEQDGMYRLAYHEDKDALAATVLHEVGHSVHHMLGNKSELIFDLVGWRAHTEADFDGWADELGGWSSIDPADQKLIREAWMMWLSSSRGDTAHESVGDMVAGHHPAVSKRYSSAGVVQLAQQKKMVSRHDPALLGDRAAFVSFAQQRWYTISKRGLLSAPSDYALTAPGEYFAECYMAYYRDYDGTPATESLKGRTLAPWIKAWFDKNVDTTTHNPTAGKSMDDD